jgi:hypothetical protein
MIETTSVERFEDRLSRNLQLALEEGGLYFERRGSVWETVQQLAGELDAHSIPYAVIGALGMFHHGYRRFTHNINVLIADDGLVRVIDCLTRFRQTNPLSRRFIDLTTGVSVLFHVEGQPPGGAVWRQIRFPPPPTDAEIDDGIRFVSLPVLISLKLAAGLSNPRRLRDIADVQEMIKELCLTGEFTERLHPDVKNEFASMCRSIDDSAGPFLLLWELSPEARPNSIEALAEIGGARRAQVEAMLCDGVRLFEPRPYYDNCAVLTTNSRVIARKYDMHHESEYLFKD